MKSRRGDNDAKGLPRKLGELPPHEPGAENRLSTRELEVLRWLCLGKTNYEIGKILGISPWTAKIHVRNVLRKLEVGNRTQAAAHAVREGLHQDHPAKPVPEDDNPGS